MVDPYPVRRQAPGDVERYQVISRDITCPSGYTYSQGRCRRRIYLDPIHENVPAQVRYEKGCPTGYQYVQSIDKCRRVVWRDPYRETYSRYRRNGRFETDLPNGQVKIDTWYEVPWLWRNNGTHHGSERILPDRYNNLAG